MNQHIRVLPELQGRVSITCKHSTLTTCPGNSTVHTGNSAWGSCGQPSSVRENDENSLPAAAPQPGQAQVDRPKPTCISRSDGPFIIPGAGAPQAFSCRGPAEHPARQIWCCHSRLRKSLPLRYMQLLLPGNSCPKPLSTSGICQEAFPILPSLNLGEMPSCTLVMTPSQLLTCPRR